MEKQEEVDQQEGKKEFDIKKVIERLSAKSPKLAEVFKKVKIAKQVGGTAAADDQEITYNPEYMAKLTEAGQDFVMAHEALHIELEHVTADNAEFDDKDLLNIAYDAQINSILIEKVGMSPPKSGVFIAGAHEFDIKQVYHILKTRKEAGQPVTDMNEEMRKEILKKQGKNVDVDEMEGVEPGSHHKWDAARERAKKKAAEAKKAPEAKLERL